MDFKMIMIALWFISNFESCNLRFHQKLGMKPQPTPVAEQKFPQNKNLSDVWKIEKIREVTAGAGSISFGPDGTGLIGGTDQHFWITRDGGSSWTESFIPSGRSKTHGVGRSEAGWYDLVESVITRSGQIYAIGHLEEVGSMIFSSSDGAGNWNEGRYPNSALNGLASAEDEVWAVGTIESSPTLLKLTKNGKWQPTWKANKNLYLESVEFINANLGWIVGANGVILHSVDGGQNFNSQRNPTTHNLNSVSFADSDNGFAVGDHGTILRTNNGGATWLNCNSGTERDLTRVRAINNSEACVVGRNGIVMRTVDSGKNWYRYPLAIDADIYALSLRGKDCWIVATDGEVFRLPSR